MNLPSHPQPRRRYLALWGTVLSGVISFAILLRAEKPPRPSSVPDRDGLKAFTDVASVLRSPRCINCHPAGDVPRQTDQRRAHFPPVNRGSDDHGVVGMRCTACHQSENQTNGVPGAPGWSLAPRSMAWEGLDDHALAVMLKDPARNGGRSLDQLVDHVEHEPLVLWGFQPGNGRAEPPLNHEQFVKRFKDWVAAGAPSPRDGKVSP